MKKNISIAVVLSQILIVMSSFSFSGGPYNIAAGKYILVPLNANNPAFPFYEDVNETEVTELLFIAADGIWTLFIKGAAADRNIQNELLVGRYQVKDDEVTFWDDTNCCSFAGKIAGDRLVLKPDDANDKYLFVRMDSSR